MVFLFHCNEFIQALLEQVSYTPAAMTSFYFLMTLLEGRSIDDSINEVKNKFLPTYKVNHSMSRA